MNRLGTSLCLALFLVGVVHCGVVRIRGDTPTQFWDNQYTAGVITWLQDGSQRISLSSNALTFNPATDLLGTKNIAASGSIQGNTLTDGIASLSAGALSGVVALTANKITSGATVLQSNALTGLQSVSTNGLSVGSVTLSGGALNMAGGSISAGTISASTSLTTTALTVGTATLSGGTLSIPGGTVSTANVQASAKLIVPVRTTLPITPSAGEIFFYQIPSLPVTRYDLIMYDGSAYYSTSLTPALCGNGVAEYNEQCDGNDIRGLTCASYGGSSATKPTCTAGCAIDSSNCLYWVSGVQHNLPKTSLGGWTQCYIDTYANSASSLASILASCNQAKLLLACAPVGAANLDTFAMGLRTDVIFDTGTGANSVHNGNGVDWYYNNSWSWGFTGQGQGVNRNSCDINGGNDRLCWHTNSGNINIGYRCGSNTGLNGSTAYNRIIYQAN